MTIIISSDVRTVIRRPVPEETTQTLSMQIVDELGIAIPGTAMEEMLLTLYALNTERTIINGRERQDILNVNGGAIDELGEFTIQLDADDNVIVDDTVELEEHVLLLEWAYDGGKQGKHEILLKVVNLEKVPAQATP